MAGHPFTASGMEEVVVNEIHVWITKYALTTGISESDATQCADNAVSWHRNGYMYWYRKPDWHLTKEEALARAEQMRVAKIASIKKSIAKLEALKFV